MKAIIILILGPLVTIYLISLYQVDQMKAELSMRNKYYKKFRAAMWRKKLKK